MNSYKFLLILELKAFGHLFSVLTTLATPPVAGVLVINVYAAWACTSYSCILYFL